MHPALEQALHHLDKAATSHYFGTIESLVPKELLHTFNALRKDYISKGDDWMYIDRLRAFVGELQNILPTETAIIETHTPLNMCVLPNFQMEDFYNLNLSYALRPELVRSYLLKLATQRQCLNIYGEEGTGKARMLTDIEQSGLTNAIFVQARIQKSFELFLQDVARQLQAPIPKHTNLTDIIEPVAQQAGKIVVLLVQGIDDLYDQTGKAFAGYDNFFSQLNALKNNVWCRVACITCLPRGQSYQEVSSPLTFDRVKIQELTYGEVRNELMRKLPLDDVVLAYLTDQLETEPTPYAALEYITEECP